MAIVSCPYWGLIHRRSAATVRTSLTWSSGRTRPARACTLWMAATAWRRGIRYSDWSSAAAGHEAHAEVGQPVPPRAGHAQLGGAVDRVELDDRVPVDGGRGRAEQLVEERLGVAGDPALDPDLVDRLAPAGEHAHAVAGGGDLVEVLVQGVPCERLEHPLADLVGRLDVQGDAGDGTEGAEPDDQAVELVVAPGDGAELAGGGDQLQAGDGGGEVALGVPEPWVAVATAPATEMWGSDARLARASPSRSSASASSPYRRPAEKLTVRRRGRRRRRRAGLSRLTSSSESARSVNECLEPSTRTRGAAATTSWTCSRVDGRCSVPARYR